MIISGLPTTRLPTIQYTLVVRIKNVFHVLNTLSVYIPLPENFKHVPENKLVAAGPYRMRHSGHAA